MKSGYVQGASILDFYCFWSRGNMEYTSPFEQGSAWDRCYHQFMQQLYRRSESDESIKAYNRFLNQFFANPSKSPEDYTREDVEAFMNRPSQSTRSMGQPPAISTINQRLAVLAAFYKYAAGYLVRGQNGKMQTLIEGLPTAGIVYGKRTFEYHAFSFEEMKQFFAVIPTHTTIGLRDRAIFLLYFWTGRRRSEITRLCYGDIKYGMATDGHGKTYKAWLYRFRGKGQGQQYKWRELPAPAKQAIDDYLEASGRIDIIQTSDPLFVATYGYTRENRRPLSAGAILYNLKRYAIKAGLDSKRLTIHSFRHTAAQQRHEAGQGIISLMEFLDHQNLDTTYRYIRGLSSTADPFASVLMETFGGL